MKPIAEMTRLELAAYVSSALAAKGLNMVLAGGSCVSIYSSDAYVSMDLDFVNAGFAKRKPIREVMVGLGFSEQNRYFAHPETQWLVEFPPGPLGVGQEPVKQVDSIATDTGSLRIISPTDCVKDRLAWYYHDNDTECLEQAVLVAQACGVDMAEIERWSRVEGMLAKYNQIRHRLVRQET